MPVDVEFFRQLVNVQALAPIEFLQDGGESPCQKIMSCFCHVHCFIGLKIAGRWLNSGFSSLRCWVGRGWIIASEYDLWLLRFCRF